jgi:hypothetical protein
MWLWIAIGIGLYLAAMVAVVAIAGSARRADRRERAIFAEWVVDRRRQAAARPALRRPKTAA